jgi:glyoxylase-like metal-dependent hydrolase (beta-lactamase superfamily II)
VEEAEVDIVMILITHGHLDHASAARATADHYDVPIIGPHRGDAFLIERLKEQGRQFGIAGADSFEPDRWLEDGDTVRLGDLVLQVVHCPGHTPGHVVFYEPESRFAVVGDVLFQGSVGRTDLPGGSFEALAHAIRDKLFPLGDDVTFLPGHGGTSTFGWERKCNPFVSDLAFGG